METVTKYECPVCFNKLFLSAKIFQCVNGHLLCDTCGDKLKHKECPQCRVKFYGKLNRSLIFEEILDGLSYVCQFSQSGCRQKLRRQDIKDHEDSCLFGTSVAVCKYLGSAFAGCNFKLSAGNTKSFLDHLLGCHHNYAKRFGTTMTLKLDVNKRYEKRGYVLKPFADRECLLLVMLAFTKSGIRSSAVDLSLGFSEDDKVEVEFSVLNEKALGLSWSIHAGVGIESWKFMKAGKTYSQHKVERESLLKYCDNEGKVEVSIRLESAGTGNGNCSRSGV